ncbi:MAG: helix-turn-helix domain-containing protein [Methanomassiliicoccales archaeon]|nr:MAG: helix-turn-helix domain-containing protein [Methanomassiliicoccales archaeon]
MPRRMVDAFKKEIEEDKEPPKGPVEVVKKTLTMNPRRQEILQYLCRYPCSRLSKIAKDLDLSNASTKWHLERLTENDFITQRGMKGDRIFYPTNMIEENDVRIFWAINNERALPILRKILSNSGINLKNLRDDVQLNQRTVVRHAYELEQVGLIDSIQDGKYKRYYPTGLFTKMKEDYRKKGAKFRRHLLKMLKKDGVNPKVVRSTDRALHVKITAGEKKSVLELGTQPFASVLERYKGL